MRWSLFLLCALVITGCGAAEPAPPAASSAHHHAAPTSAPVSSGLNPTDVAYIQLAIPQDASVLPVLELVRSRADSALVPLAADIGKTHQAELDRLHALLTSASLSYEKLHDGHDMPGMVTEPEMTALKAAQGPAFDDLARGLLRTHFEESSTVARGVLVSGSDAGLRALVQEMERSRTGYLSRLAAR